MFAWFSYPEKTWRRWQPTTREHFRAMFVWFSYPEKTWRRWELFATIAPCAHTTRLLNNVGKFCMSKINLSYFPSGARLNFRWIFKEFGLKSNMKWFFVNFLALSVKKLKKVLMILPSITGRGRAFLAESCLGFFLFYFFVSHRNKNKVYNLRLK